LNSEELIRFFTAFKSAHGNGYLITHTASSAFLSAYLECLVYISKALKSQGSLSDLGEAVIQPQWKFLWNVLISKSLNIKLADAVKPLARALANLEVIQESEFLNL
jgi:hypothetical protein